MRLALGIVLLTGGCRQVLGIDSPILGDAGANDDGPGLDAACATFGMPLIGDAIIVPSSPSFSYGSISVMNIGSGIRSRGLVQFDLSGAPSIDAWTSAVLVLPFEPHDAECGMAGCQTSCAPIERPGPLHLHAMRPDWAQTSVTWDSRDLNLAWQNPGASGALDASAELQVVNHVASMDTRFVFDGNAIQALRAWATSTRLAFQVRADLATDGVAIVRAVEATCTANGPRSQLTISVCP